MCGLSIFKVLTKDPKTLSTDELIIVAMLLELKNVNDTEASRSALISFQAMMGQMGFSENEEQIHQSNPSQ
jgi:hypothetical protein